MFQRILKLPTPFFLSLIVVLLGGCGDGDKVQPVESPTARSPRSESMTVDVKVAPFNQFPTSDEFGFKLRFSKPIVSRVLGRGSTSDVTITPAVPGIFRWTTDSELSFIPEDPLPAGSKYELDLSKIKPGNGRTLASSHISVVMPEPNLKIDGCYLTKINDEPIVKQLSVTAFLNYPLDGFYRNYGDGHLKILEAARSRISIKRILDGEELAIPVTVRARESSLTLDISGNDMLRPGKDGSVRLKIEPGIIVVGGKPLPGDECEVKFLDSDWRTALTSNLADSEAKKLPLEAYPVAQQGPVNDGKESITVRFASHDLGSTSVTHKRPTGEIVEKGLSIEPPIAGEWRISSDTQITFSPTQTRIPGQTYTITLEPKEFPELNLKSTEARFEAYTFRGSITSVDAGTVPEDPSRRVVSAKASFNYPIKAESLERITSVTTEQKGVAGSKGYSKFSIVPGEDGYSAYIKSEALELKDYPLILDFKLDGQISSTLGGNAAVIVSSHNYTLPSRLEIFSIQDANLSVAKSSKDELERILTVTASEDVDEAAVTKNISIELLPNCKDLKNSKICDGEQSFSNEEQVTKEVQKNTEQIPLTYVSRTENGSEESFSYSFQAPGDRQIMVSLRKGLTSKLGFPLPTDYRYVLHVKEYPKRLNVMMDGSLVSLSGSRRLGIIAQNIQKIRYRLSRIRATDLHHLVYLASGDFKSTKPEGSLTYDDLSQPYEFVEELPQTPSGKPAYTSVDFTRFMASGGELPRGLFYLEVNEGVSAKATPATSADSEKDSDDSSESECDEDGNCSYDDESESSDDESSVTSDSRMILLTDLGIVVKRQLSGEQKVYVASFRKGEPVAGATVKIISRNGNALFTATTNQNGEVSFPRADEFTREKEPVLYVADKDGDLTFIPYQRRDRELNLSRFDIGGVVNSDEPDALRALMFTDRGIYRPGETVKFGLTVRNRDMSVLQSELPLTVRITDPSGQTIAKDVVRFPKLGIADYTFETSQSMSTGTYTAALIIPARPRTPDQSLASIEFRVEEFEPDRLAIAATLGVNDQGQFKKIEGLEAKVTLKNLFGAPAVENTVKASFVVDPWSGALATYPGFNFRPMLSYEDRQHSVLDLGELSTDESGEAVFPISIAEVSGVVLEGMLSVEGFEKESGRSVATNSRGLVTDLQTLLGVRSVDSLEYVEKGAVRRLELQAIDLNGAKTSSGNIKVALEREEYRNVLVKQSNGVYKYDSAKKMVPISETDIVVSPDGRNLELDTQSPGTFVLSFTDESQVLLNQIRYSVVGEGNDAIRVNRNANLELALNRPSYSSQSEAELSIKAPYAGFGVISIERDKVLTSTWFKTSGTASVHKIKLPAGIFGNAYVTVLLARAWDSKEIYLPPLSFASVPLAIDESEYVAPPKLEVPKVVKPGESITVKYTAKEDGALVVYAVDEGILQFGKYRAPDPLKALVPKRALEVVTRTALDLVVPDYSIVQSILTTGGDEDADLSKFQNPFKKRQRPPLAVWSGIVSVKAGEGTYSIQTPDYFDGSIKVFAYFVGLKRTGISQTRTEIRGDFVIKPNVPTFAAPGDIFELPVEVTNTLSSTQDAEVSLDGSGIEVVGEKKQSLSLKPFVGQVAHFKVKANDSLGEATFKIVASSGATSRTASDGISIRPASPIMRTVKFGVFDPEQPGATNEKKVTGLRQMYSELREVTAYISHSPGLFVDSLQQFMQQYPYSCSEQLTSRAFISLLMSGYSQDSTIKAKLQKEVEGALRTVVTRMNADGSIAYWRRGEDGNPFVSVYAAHLMLEAREKGFAVPKWAADSSKEFLTTKSEQNLFTLEDMFPQAYALYLRARNGEVVTKQLDSMVGRLSATSHKSWKGSALSWLIAATYKQLRMEDKVSEYTTDTGELKFSDLPFPINMPAVNFGITNYVKVRHFGGSIPKDLVFSALNRLDNGSPDSLTSSSLALGLLAGSEAAENPGALAITAANRELPLTNTVVHKGEVPLGTLELNYVGPKDRHYFYSLVESGFDRTPAQQGSRTQGVSVARDVVDAEGKSVTEMQLGESYRVVLRIKSENTVSDFAVQDLLPAGFEPDLDALKDRRSIGGESDAWLCENVDVRDDRLILFGDLSAGTVVFSYPIKPTVKGQLVWPGLYGEAMYDSRIFAWEKSTSVVVK